MRSYKAAFLWFFALWLSTAQASTQNILIIGDSLSTAYGFAQNEGWTVLLAERLNSEGHAAQVINESISGETTAGGLRRLPELLTRHQPALVLIELGGNDGLQGLPIEHIKSNLNALITQSQAAGAQVLLIGMLLPPNYGAQYTQAFAQMYPGLAKTFDVALVPFLLEGVGGYEAYMQDDGIHPNSEAQQIMLDNVWPSLQAWQEDTK